MPTCRRCGHTLSFVPWWALLSLGLLVGGITLMAIKGPAAADAADVLLGQLSSDTGTGYPKYMSIYSTSVWVTVGVAGAGVAALILGASVRLDQRLRKAGKYGQAKGSYGPLLFKFYSFLDWMGLILMTLLALWAVVIGVMLASWASQCWNLEQVRGTGGQLRRSLTALVLHARAALQGVLGDEARSQSWERKWRRVAVCEDEDPQMSPGPLLATSPAPPHTLQGAAVASANMAALDDMASKYTQNLNNFAAAVMAAAGGTSELSEQRMWAVSAAGGIPLLAVGSASHHI